MEKVTEQRKRKTCGGSGVCAYCDGDGCIQCDGTGKCANCGVPWNNNVGTQMEYREGETIPNLDHGLMSEAHPEHITGTVEVTDVQRLQLEPGDVLVVFSDKPLAQAHIGRLSERLSRMFPDNQVLVLDRGLHIAVLGSLP